MKALLFALFLGLFAIGASLDGPDDIETAQLTAQAVTDLGETK